MHLRLIIVAAVLLCFTATADTIRGTPIRPASIYLSPDASSNKLADIERGREVIVLETSGDGCMSKLCSQKKKLLPAG